MEYFDFQDASHEVPPFDLDDLDSLAPNITEQEGNDTFESIFFDKSHILPADINADPTTPAVVKLKLINDVEIEAVPQEDDLSLGYPMFRAKNPCDLCARMGLDCFLASRGVMITGCTCCISLYKDCSFTHPKIPKGFVSTFQGVPEDSVWTDFSRQNRRSLRSHEEIRTRKNGARFPRDATKILKQWLGEHADHPYPNEREKDQLKQLTGLKRSQIANWLANARRRGKVRPPSDPSSPMLGAIDIPQAKNANDDWTNLNPMDRWKASPPENEPASMTAIARAVTSTPLPGRTSSQSSQPGSRASSRKNSSEESSAFSMFQAPSVSSFETRESSNSELTMGSSRSNNSKHSYSSAERRRRRRAPMTQRAAAQQTKSRSARIFQCTFCTDTFPAKYDWQRHEKSLHLALERWTCCPDNSPTITNPSTGITHCIFCNTANPTPTHLESHNFQTCQEKTLQERTFYRKDHLRQHLKLMHNSKFEASHMESWKSTTNEIKSSCGFCPSQFSTWSQRADHLAAHFRNGADMTMWSNGWGFEPYVERLVENSIPPYLIGHERQTMQPYVARLTQPGQIPAPRKRGSVDSKANKSTPTSGSNLTYGTSAEDENTGESDIDPDAPDAEFDQMTRDSNCWGRLEQELSKYVTTCKLSGTVPTDKELQDHARMVIYEDDDPWNWTCADNQQWLDTFKFQQGIGGVTENMGSVVGRLEEVNVLAPYVVKGGNKNAHHNSNSGGGNGNGNGVAKSSAANAGGRGRGRGAAWASNLAKEAMISGTMQDFKQRHAIKMGGMTRTRSWGNMPQTNTLSDTAGLGMGKTMDMGLGNEAAIAALPDFDNNMMSMDFDGVDFHGLEFDMAGMGMDDVTYTTAPNIDGTMASTTTSGGMSALTAALSGAGSDGMYAPAPASMGMDGVGQYDFAGGMNGDNDQGMGMRLGLGDNGIGMGGQEGFMTEREMNELAGYSASFH